MTVVNPKSISGINSITTGSGSDNLLTIHTSDANNTERVRVNSSGDVIIGSGVTLSPDGDIFATGITTVSGNVKVGTGITLSPDGDIFATGVCTATSFIGNGSGLTNLSTDLVNDTSPQLGGDLQSNSHDIKIADASGTDGNNIYMGSDNDMRIHHDGSNFEMSNSTGTIYLRTDSAVHIQKRDGTTKIAEFNADADVELYHNGTKVCDTSTTGILMANGKGIDFANTSGSAAGSTASVLDDYEEGSFTPTQGGTSIGGYSEQHGRYVKIGKMVTINIRLQSSANTSSGNFKLHGLPFTSAASASDVYGSGGITYCDIPLNKKSFDPYIGSNSTDVQFYEKTTGTGVSLNSNYSNGYMGLAAIYYVD